MFKFYKNINLNTRCVIWRDHISCRSVTNPVPISANYVHSLIHTIVTYEEQSLRLVKNVKC